MTDNGEVIVCGPAGYRLQGKCNVSINGIEVTGSNDKFQIRGREIDRILMIRPPVSVVMAGNSSDLNQRRFGSSSFPPLDWFTLGIGTKDFLYFELSVRTFLEQRRIYDALKKQAKLPPEVFDEAPSSQETIFDENWFSASLASYFDTAVRSKILKITNFNEKFKICPTYGETVVVPTSIDKSIVEEASFGRSGCRFPVAKYFHHCKGTILATAGEANFANASGTSNTNASTVTSASNRAASFLSSNDSGASSSSNQSSGVSSHSRANELLLEAMLPERKRGTIIDLRSDGSFSSSLTSSSSANNSAASSVSSVTSTASSVASTVSSTLYATATAYASMRQKKKSARAVFEPVDDWQTSEGGGDDHDKRRMRRRKQKKHKHWPFRPHTATSRDYDIDRFDQRWKLVQKPLPDVEEIAKIFTTFIQDITKPTETAALQPESNAAVGEDPTESGNGVSTSVKVSLKKTSPWLCLVREVLAIANIGACALDGRDKAATDQLLHDRNLFARTTGSTMPPDELKARLDAMTPSGSSVLVVGKEGRDRCLLVVSLIQIILSPAVRTIRGFCALLHRDWLSAGHPFGTRCAHLLETPESAYTIPAPIFLLFLDCLWQLWCQYPSSFEFNEELLLLLAKNAYSNEFGTFSGDCDAWRESEKASLQKRPSFWAYIHKPEVVRRITNVLYVPSDPTGVSASVYCWPCIVPQVFNVWREVYQKVLLPYPCRIWSDQREALAKAHEEYTEALKTAQNLERIVRDMMKEAMKRNLLPA